MRSIPASRQSPSVGFSPALHDFAAECRAIALPMLAYLSVLALLVLGAMYSWDGLDVALPAPPAGWSQQRPGPAPPQDLQLRGTL